MIKTRLYLILIIGFLIGCDSVNINPGGNINPSNGLTRASARNLKQLILDSDEYLVAMFASPSEFKTLSTSKIPKPLVAQLNAANVLPQAIDCFSENNPSIDKDNDGVPADGFYIIDCTLTNDQNGSSVSLSGSSRVQDTDDDDPKSGYKVDTDEFELRAINSQGQISYLKLDLDVYIIKESLSYSVAYNFNLAAKDIIGPENGITYTYTATYVPDDSNNPFAGGTIVYNGSKNFRGESGSYTLNAVANNLHYTETCARGFNGGSKTYTDNKGNILRFVYNSCGNVSISFNNILL